MMTLNSFLTPASETRGHGCHLLHQWNNRSLSLFLSISFTMFAIFPGTPTMKTFKPYQIVFGAQFINNH